MLDVLSKTYMLSDGMAQFMGPQPASKWPKDVKSANRGQTGQRKRLMPGAAGRWLADHLPHRQHG